MASFWKVFEETKLVLRNCVEGDLKNQAKISNRFPDLGNLEKLTNPLFYLVRVRRNARRASKNVLIIIRITKQF